MSDNLWRKIERIIKPLYIIIAFLMLLALGLSREASAETGVEVAGGFLSGSFSRGGALYLNERFHKKYSVAMGYISEQWVTPRKEPRTYVRPNLCFQAMRHVGVTENFELGLGPAYCTATNRALGSNVSAALEMRYYLGARGYAFLRHYSNAGSKPPNMGQDIIGLGFRFK